jgi:hypothetical protein
MKPATNRLAGRSYSSSGAADLLDDAVVHDHDLVGHGHGLDLVVRDVDRGGLQALVQLLDLGAHLHAQLGVEVGQRLVEQEHLRVAHDGAAHGHALALAAGELRGKRSSSGVRPRMPAAWPTRSSGGVGPGRLGQGQRKGHVVAHRHVRVQRVVLEHHRDVALLGRRRVDQASPMQDLALGDVLQPGHHAQQRALAAAAGADQHGARPWPCWTMREGPAGGADRRSGNGANHIAAAAPARQGLPVVGPKVV